MPDGFSLLLAFLAISFASLVKATIGFGFPLIAVPILANVLDPRTAVVMMSVPVLVANFMIIVRGGGTRAGARRLAVVMASLVLGTFLGAQLLARLDVGLLSLLVGLFTVAFVGLNLARANLTIPAKNERYLSPLIGFVGGLMGGTTNIFAPVVAPYLHSLRLPKREFVFGLTLLFTLGGITQVASYFQLGLYSGPILLYALLACVPMALGIWLGLKVQDRISPRLWNWLVLTVLFVSGLNLIVRGLVG